MSQEPSKRARERERERSLQQNLFRQTFFYFGWLFWLIFFVPQCLTNDVPIRATNIFNCRNPMRKSSDDRPHPAVPVQLSRPLPDSDPLWQASTNSQTPRGVLGEGSHQIFCVGSQHAHTHNPPFECSSWPRKGRGVIAPQKLGNASLFTIFLFTIFVPLDPTPSQSAK